VSCATCHADKAGQLAASVHKTLHCQECHGGPASYGLSAEEAKRYRADHHALPGKSGSARFDHGAGFKGKPSRRDVPAFCGDCHADVERMNPYGLHTDQLVRYRTSVHGKTLFEKGDDRVAVCTDCHGSHDVLSSHDSASKTYPLNVPDTCAHCHANKKLMGSFGLPSEIVDEYRHSVHGRLLLEQHDTGAPTCATCHGNHAAAPPGFGAVGAVCGRCHPHVEENYLASIHASQEGFDGCIQCHGGGEGHHRHFIQRITVPAGRMIHRYAELLRSVPDPTPEQITAAIHPQPRRIIDQAMSTCTECHDEPDEDESIPKLFKELDRIARGERHFVKTAHRLDVISQGVLLVEDQQFQFEEAKTHLIALAPVQHRLDPAAVDKEAAKLDQVCDEVNGGLDHLEHGLQWRYRSLIPIWAFAVIFAGLLYAKYRRLDREYVEPAPANETPGNHS